MFDIASICCTWLRPAQSVTQSINYFNSLQQPKQPLFSAQSVSQCNRLYFRLKLPFFPTESDLDILRNIMMEDMLGQGGSFWETKHPRQHFIQPKILGVLVWGLITNMLEEVLRNIVFCYLGAAQQSVNITLKYFHLL